MRTVADVVFLTFHYVSTHSSYNDVKPFVRAKSKCAPLAASSVPVARVCFSREPLEMTVFWKSVAGSNSPIRVVRNSFFFPVFPCWVLFHLPDFAEWDICIHPSYLDRNVWATPELSLGVVDAAWKRGKWCQKKSPKLFWNRPKMSSKWSKKCPKSGQWCQKGLKTR